MVFRPGQCWEGLCLVVATATLPPPRRAPPTDLSGTNSSGRLRVPLGQQLVAPQHLTLGGVVGAQDEVLARAAQLQRRRIRSISYTVDRTSGAGASAANTSASVRALGRGSPRPSPRERRHRIAAACLHW